MTNLHALEYVRGVRERDPGIGGVKLWLMYVKAFAAGHPMGRDRGCQYASHEYVGRLKDRGISISMTECGDPKDNAQAERVNSTMKNELLKGMVFHDICDVRRAVSRAVDFYNNERPHMSLDMMTPAEAASRTGEIARRWRSYRQEAIKKSAECAGCD